MSDVLFFQQNDGGAMQLALEEARHILGQQLALLGLRLKRILGDGNCFFNSCSDQLKVC